MAHGPVKPLPKRSRPNPTSTRKAQMSKAVDRVVDEVSTRLPKSSPFQRLPPELFCEIIRLTVVADEYHIYRLKQLCRVSESWATHIDTNPLLWRVINVQDGNKLVAEAIKKSGNLLLDIKYDAVCLPANHDLVRLVCTSADRWQSLEIKSRDVSWDVLRVLLSQTAPKLRRVYLDGHDSPGSDRRRVFPLGSGCDLTIVDVAFITFQLDSSKLSGLRFLRITNPHVVPTVSEILSVLEAARKLEYLEFSDWGTLLPLEDEDENEDEKGSLIRRVELPYLKTVVFDGLELRSLVSFMSTIHAPNCRRLSITTNDPEEVLNRRGLCFPTLLHPFFQLASSVGITLDHTSVTLRSSTPGSEPQQFELRVAAYRSDHLQWLKRFSSSLHAINPSARFSMNKHSPIAAANQLPTDIILELVPLHALSIDISETTDLQILNRLARACEHDARGYRSWLSPDLKILRIHQKGDVDIEANLVYVLTGRWGTWHTTGTDGGCLERPRSLDRLEVTSTRSMDQGMVRAILCAAQGIQREPIKRALTPKSLTIDF
ncbi:hypothetical protein FRB99_006790 [Tulasnella sp. 403]|nr:hypothetical protein FRB99_006790 [Tulasnella sp. 403]